MIEKKDKKKKLFKSLDRRGFMKQSGFVIGGGTLLNLIAPGAMAASEEKQNMPQPKAKTAYRRSVCTHCSVGCGVIAEVQNGVWTGQEPDF